MEFLTSSIDFSLQVGSNQVHVIVLMRWLNYTIFTRDIRHRDFFGCEQIYFSQPGNALYNSFQTVHALVRLLVRSSLHDLSLHCFLRLGIPESKVN